MISTRISRRAILVLFAILSFAGCRDNYLAEKEFWKAERILRQISAADFQTGGAKTLDPAIEAYERVVTRYPGTPKAIDSLFVIANLRVQQNDLPAAREAMSRLIQNYSSSQDKAAKARYAIGQLFEKEGDWKKAEAAYWEAAEYHRYHAKGAYAPIVIMSHYKQVRDVKGEQEAFEKAIDYYRKSLKQVGPIQASAAVKNYLAMTHFLHGDWKRAIEIWLSIQKELPDSAHGPLSLLAVSDAYAQNQDLDHSIQYAEEFLKKYPKHGWALKTAMHLGALYLEKKDFKSSQAWFSKGLEYTKDPFIISEIELSIAEIFQKQGLWEEADKAYRKIEAKYPDSKAKLRIPFLRYDYYLDKGDKDKAALILEEALQLYQTIVDNNSNPNSNYVKRLQYLAYSRKGDWLKILDTVDQYMQKEPTSERKGKWLLLKALISENRLQDRSKALAFYQSFLNDYSDHPLVKMAKVRYDSLLKSLQL